MVPWEALDVDDSDLPFLLRPCDHRHSQPNANSNPIVTTLHCQSILTPCSQSTSKTLSQALTPPSSTSLQPQLLQSRHRLIPGPAGAVQAAMLHKTLDNRNFSCPEDNPVPTQEYIRRAVEDAHEDDDFQRSSWCSALSFIHQSSVDAVVNYTPLSSIKKCSYAGKIDQVVAIIKSCTPNGLGNMMVTLKDPTGTIGASIHRKVLCESEFAKDISVGSVLILQKVSVFSPSESVHYLNVTPKNIVKVISKDVGVQSEQNCPVSTGICVACDAEHSERTETLQLAEEGQTDRIMAAIRQNINVRGSLRDDCLMEKRDTSPVSSKPNNSSGRSQNACLEEETPSGRRDVDNIWYKDAVRMDTTDDNHNPLNNIHEWSRGGNMSSNLTRSSTEANLVETTSYHETQRTDGVQKQRLPLRSKPSLLRWTDEQLGELFAMECEDDNSLYE